MAVYHFTIHAYRSWMPDHPRGYTEKGKGYQPPDPDKAADYERRAKQSAVTFDTPIQRTILALLHGMIEREGWTLHAVAFDPTHVHILVSWREFYSWEEADRRLKNLLALRLNRFYATPGKRWFVRRHSAPRRVKDRKHLDHLQQTYLPDHPGIFWMHGMEVPRLDETSQ